jgi:hypothetical protein
MAERKVLNKYYPPDFDPSKLRIYEKKSTRRMCNVRMMLPMSVRCYTCGNYMYIGTKFNMKVETISDEDYLGIKIYRFYFKCTRCYAMITFKTDPKNHDYISETGAARNHEPWKDMLMAEEEYKEMKKIEMKEDAMKSLEHRTYDSKREMDILDALDQVKNLNRRQAVINHDELIEKAVKGDDSLNEMINNEIEKEAKEKFSKNKIRKIEDYNLDRLTQVEKPVETENSKNNLNSVNLVSTQKGHDSGAHPSMLGHKNKRNEQLNNNLILSDSDDDSDEKEEYNKFGSLSFSGVNLKVKKIDDKNLANKQINLPSNKAGNENNKLTNSMNGKSSLNNLKNNINDSSMIKRPLIPNLKKV